jgi:hypothetical protein
MLFPGSSLEEQGWTVPTPDNSQLYKGSYFRPRHQMVTYACWCVYCRYFNMLCAFNGTSNNEGWSRYTSTDPQLMSWKLADRSFTDAPTLTNWSQSGAMFTRISNASTDGSMPTHMLNANNGSGYWLGTYDSQTEKFHVDQNAGLQQIDNGPSFAWAATGNAGPGASCPTTNTSDAAVMHVCDLTMSFLCHNINVNCRAQTLIRMTAGF